MRIGFSDLQRSEVRCAPGEAVIHRWNRHGCIHCAAAGFQAEIQIHGVIHGVALGRIGGDHSFEDIEIDLASTEYAPPAPPLDLSSFTPARQFSFMRAPAGWSSEWHPSSARNIFFVLSGEWEVTASDGETRRFAAGRVLLAEDTIGKGHASRVLGDSLAVMVQL